MIKFIVDIKTCSVCPVFFNGIQAVGCTAPLNNKLCCVGNAPPSGPSLPGAQPPARRTGAGARYVNTMNTTSKFVYSSAQPMRDCHTPCSLWAVHDCMFQCPAKQALPLLAACWSLGYSCKERNLPQAAVQAPEHLKVGLPCTLGMMLSFKEPSLAQEHSFARVKFTAA